MKNRIYKCLFIFAALLSALALSGCVKITVRGEITSDFTAIYEGHLEFDSGKSEYSQAALAHESLLKLSEYWQSIGYESGISAEGETYSVYFKKLKQCQSYEDAFQQLFDMMTGEYSPFSSLGYEYIEYTNYKQYIISGSIKAQDVIDEKTYNSMNDEIKQKIASETANPDIFVEFVLPNQDNLNQAEPLPKIFSSPISMSQLTEFSFTGKIYNKEIIASNKDIIEKYNYYSTLKYVLIAILVIFSIFILIALIKIIKK